MKALNLSFLVLLLAAALLGGAACRRNEAAKPPDKGSQPVVVTVAPVLSTNWDKAISIVGTLYPKDSATLGAEVDGVVERTLVDFGDRVKEGQDLAFIDTASYQALAEQSAGNVAKAEASLVNARQNFTRSEELRKAGVASASDFDQARAQLDQAEAELKAARGGDGIARLNVGRSRVRAPFDGAIAQRIASKGDYLKIGAPLFEIVNDAVLKFIFQVPERYASQVQKRLPVRFSVDNYPGEVFRGGVYLISPSVTTGSRAFGVGALVTNTQFRLKANTFARGSLVLQEQVPTVIVPLESVVSFAGISKIFVLDSQAQTARSRAVTTGRIQEGWQEILDGVKPGESVIVTGQNRLTEGARVVLQSAASAKPSQDRSAAASKDPHEKH